MIAYIRVLFAVACLALLLSGRALCHQPQSAAAAAAAAPAADSSPVRLLEGLGNHRLSISTRVPEAQRFFDQGLMLAWGFNFAAAGRSFREAARLDPDCAMCRWGIAYALGPSINHDMKPEAAAAARAAIEEARALAPTESLRERALIEALERRHPRSARAPSESAYARAMRDVARCFPRDADVLTLYADALMSPHGRDYWRRDGRPLPWTPEILAVLERALAIAPDHPGALHFYIHALEDSPHPERALAAARRLPALAPGVAHLVHMPAHVYFRLGEYAEAVAANERAIASDRAYLEAMPADFDYVAGYAEHNHHFLWAAAMMSGRLRAAQDAAAELRRYAESFPPQSPASANRQHFMVLPLYTAVRFGRWEAILAEPRPAAATAYTDGVWHFARAMALVRGGATERARGELEALEAAQRIAARDAAALKNTNRLSSLLAVAARLLKAELAGASGNSPSAIAHARAAVRLEARLETDEPPAWLLPARHTLGALLLESGRSADAERVYRDDLRIHPENGWALAGLADCLARQGRAAAATEVRSRFERAWAGADSAIGGSRF